MIKCILISLLCLVGTTSTFAQSEITEAYFHELRGMEDSSGVTHLFYRQYEKSSYQCSESDGGQTIYSTYNNIYHFDTESSSSSVKFSDYYSPWCLDGMSNSEGIIDYDFYDNDPAKWIKNSSFEYTYGVEDYLGNDLNFQIPIAVKQQNASLYQHYSPLEFYISPNQDSLFMDSDGTTIPFPGDSENWPEFIDHNDFLNYADSLSFPLEMLGISPVIDSVYFAKDARGHLYRSTNFSGDFVLVDSTGALTKIAFDADSSVVYSLITIRENSRYSQRLIKSEDFGAENSWTNLSIPETNSRFEFLKTDTFVDGYLFLADSNTVYSSSDFGVNFSKLFSSRDLITGLYKKPNSEILYVLTRKELLVVNVETKEITSLKKLPVSNEPNPSEIPQQISLKQNYPNPFNPSTSIGFQVKNSGPVLLEVYDALGKKVQTLVDGYREAGLYVTRFDAKQLASGIYFYRLEADGDIHTKRMTLIK